MNNLGLTGLLVLTVLASGCITGSGADGFDENIELNVEDIDTDETAGEILESSFQTAESIETYQLESTNKMAFDTFLMGLSISIDSKGYLDYSEEVSYLKNSGAFDIGVLGMSTSSDYETINYVTHNQTQVLKTLEGEQNNLTSKEEGFSESYPLNLSVGSLEDLADPDSVELEGQETVRSTDTYVLSTDPGVEALGKSFGDVLESYGSGSLADTENDETEDLSEDDSIEKLESYLWIDQETREPVKHSYHIVAEIEDEDASDGYLELFSETYYTEYGEDQSYTVSEEFS